MDTPLACREVIQLSNRVSIFCIGLQGCKKSLFFHLLYEGVDFYRLLC